MFNLLSLVYTIKPLPLKTLVSQLESVPLSTTLYLETANSRGRPQPLTNLTMVADLKNKRVLTTTLFSKKIKEGDINSDSQHIRGMTVGKFLSHLRSVPQETEFVISEDGNEHFVYGLTDKWDTYRADIVLGIMVGESLVILGAN